MSISFGLPPCSLAFYCRFFFIFLVSYSIPPIKVTITNEMTRADFGEAVAGIGSGPWKICNGSTMFAERFVRYDHMAGSAEFGFGVQLNERLLSTGRLFVSSTYCATYTGT